MRRLKNNLGLTMIELLIGVLVLLILVSTAVPGLRDFFITYQLKSAAEQLHTDLRLAQTEAKQRRVAVYFSFQTGNNWCYGLNDNSSCSCSTSNNCQLNGATVVNNSNNYAGTRLNTNSSSSDIVFDRLRGTIDNPTTFTVSNGSKSINVTINSMGEISQS